MSRSAERVAEASRALAAAGQSDLVWGHVSLRDPDGRGAWMKAAGWGFEEVTAERAVLVAPDGHVLDGDGPAHLEYPIHTAILEARPDVQAVVHTHGRAALAFAALDVPLLPLSHDAIPFLDFLDQERPGGTDVPRHTSGRLVRDLEHGTRLAKSLGQSSGCLLPGHGLVAVGESLAAAVMHAVLLERACATQLQALAAGEIRRYSSTGELAHKRAETWTPHQLDAGYAYLCRSAERQAR
ncbi:class II aldolase/adducin family protein [Streptomyces viridiviolaceus]